ncbi:MAG: M1 family metallopeptidase [Gemmatimonadota bacterium]|jgi:hypothetical protein
MALHGLLPALLAASSLSPQQAPEPWQQGVEYRIEARLDEDAEVLTARARVWYRNESPDTLTDFYLHLYLNAFRPNSAYARDDLEHGIHMFQDLGPEEHGFEHLSRMAVDGRDVTVSYPFAPDSTVVRLILPRPLPPGGEITLDYDWQARPSTVPRRQGRRGRHYDFAQWYPRVAVYDLEGWRPHPLYRQGEFYSEFATYDVTLDVASDQVMGATGVPVEGDPGWAGAAAPGTGPVRYQRDWYGSTGGAPCVVQGGERVCGISPQRDLPAGASLGLLVGSAGPGRKQVRWHAENVHHFAWSTSPDYIYEQGEHDGVQLRVLYQPGDQATWGHGRAVERMGVALQWLEHVYGTYPYPQVTNVHRIEGGGTEFPMMVMNGSASQSLILHEMGHIYTFGILANNEWYEGWLDEGFTSFQTAWFFEERGGGRAQWLGSEMRIMDMELRGKAEPVTLQAERYAEMGTYSAMIYTKGSLVLWMLREMVGRRTMLDITRTFFERYKFRHVDQHAFQSVAEEVSRRDLDWFFGEWLHANGLTDYALEGVRTRRDGQAWVSEVDIARKGRMRMPVPVRLMSGDQVRDTVVPGDALHWTHTIRTDFRPDRIQLDPLETIMDWNVLNDGWGRGLFGGSPYAVGLDNPLKGLPAYRDAVALRLFPLAWTNDAGGVVAGFQARTSYLGGIRDGLLRVGLPAVAAGGRGDASNATDPGSVYFRMDNPILFGRPRFGMRVEGFAGEGRGLFHLRGERDVSPMPVSGPRRYLRTWLTATALYDPAYVHPGRWGVEKRGATEVGVGLRQESRSGWSWALGTSTGLDTRDHAFARATASADLEAGSSRTPSFGLRLFGGGIVAHGSGGWDDAFAPRERQLFLAGGDPYQAISNPWVRSAGALLEKGGRTYGGGDLVGYAPVVALTRLLTASAELRTATATVSFLGRRISGRALAFGGTGMGSDPGDVPDLGDPAQVAGSGYAAWSHLYATAGGSLEVGFAGSPLRLRVDFPVFVADPELAAMGRDDRLAFRYAVSVVRTR